LIGFPIPGVVVDRNGERRTILTELFGSIQTSIEGPLTPILYAGSWRDVAMGEKVPWSHWLPIVPHMTRKQLECSHLDSTGNEERRVAWDEERCVPTRLHASVPCRLLFCITCGLLLTFKL
jgi:hypothetical protein